MLTQAAGQGHIYLPWTELEQGVTALLLIDIRDMERHIMDMAIDKKLLSVKMRLAKSAFMLRCIIIWRLLLPSI